MFPSLNSVALQSGALLIDPLYKDKIAIPGRISDKCEFNRLSQAGWLGNFLRIFDTLGEVHDAGYRGWLIIRSHVKQSPHFVPWVSCNMQAPTGYPTLEEAVDRLLGEDADSRMMYFSEVPAPAARRVIQFEAMLAPTWQGSSWGGVDLFYELDSTLPVRGIRERCLTAGGLKAQQILRTLLRPSSYDTLMDIWERFPTAMIEATEFSEPVGEFRQHLVLWEVRDF